MAGKRLIDAVQLLNAGRSIAKQHVALRQQQWDIYTKTSSLAKAVKSQTDRVTVTVGAAYELAKRFNEAGPAWQQRQEQTKNAFLHVKDTVTGQGTTQARHGAHERSEQQVRAHSVSGIHEDNASTTSPRGDGTPSSLRKREMQREAERQIPEISADAQPDSMGPGGQDTFSERTKSVSPELSSLPRSKIPKYAEDNVADGNSFSDQGLNQDVFYGTRDSTQISTQGENEESGSVYTDAFSSSRIAQMLGGTEMKLKNPYAGKKRLAPKPLPEMVAAEERRKREREVQEPRIELETQSSSPSVPDQVPATDAETQQLAQSIAQEAESQAEPPASNVSSEAEELPFEMRESKVPSSRFARFWQYSGLATSMALGAVGESFRRFAGGRSEGSLMLSDANMNRLVARLSRMRGAALKLGQMISFQDSKVLPPAMKAVLQRVQDSADYMPPWQRDKVLMQNLGDNWRDLFSKFEEKPFAAASIGQVHKATLASSGKDVAVKVQYPGVRDSIDSDLSNLSLLLTASRLLPKGLFLDRTIANARVELGWECDYEREAQACIHFKQLLKDEETVFDVPEVYTEASGPGVLTAEFMTGTAVAKIKDLSQQGRDWIGTQILRLCLRELMEWRYMQTDPNWTNFLYNKHTKKLELLDFGASREYPDKFVEPYVSLLIAASKGDRDACRDLSIQLGYLTGEESRQMLQAHVDSILTLAEPFVESAPDVYDFENQTITDRVRANIGLMLRERLAPPPEESYSLHRKLSGAFLLCARLKSKVPAREMFQNAVKVWRANAERVSGPAL